MKVDRSALRADVEALAGMGRGSASAGEREAAAWIAGRLRERGVGDVRVEAFRGRRTFAWSHLAHAVAGLVAARLGGGRGAALAAGALLSLELEASGRASWLARFLGRSEGANVVARVPARGERRRTAVLVVHHDAARTGWTWRLLARLPVRPRRVEPFEAAFAAGLALVAAGCAARKPGAQRAGALPLAVAAAAQTDIARSAVVPGASDNASGVAALLALAEALAAAPLEHVEVLGVSTGCEESGMDGMRAFLRGHGAELDPGATVVVGLDTLGGEEPIVCAAEGAVLTHRYREQDLALVDEGASRAGLDPPARWRIGGWTDPVLARFAGLPAVCLLSAGPRGLQNYHLPTDIPDGVDWDCVERCVRLAAGTLEAFAAQGQRVAK